MPDFEDRAKAMAGVDSVQVNARTGEDEHSQSGGCRVESTDDEETGLSIGLTQESDSATEVRENDPEVYPGCFMGTEPFDSSSVYLRCRPSLRVRVGAAPTESGIRPWPNTPDGSSVRGGEPAQEYLDLLHDVLVELSKQG